VFKHKKKHDVHNIHRLAWGPYVRGGPWQLVTGALRYFFTKHSSIFFTFNHKL